MGANDLFAEVSQSVCDKLLSSAGYPLVLMERKEDFPGCRSVLTRLEKDFYRYSVDEVDEMFRACVPAILNRTDDENSIHDDIFAFGGSIIQQAKLILDAHDGDPERYEGPERADLKTIIDGGIENLGTNLRSLVGDFDVYAWNPHLKVTLKTQPKLRLASPRIDLDGVRVEILAKGELWVKYPWWNCHKWCIKWKKVVKCDRIGSITVSPDIAADAHAEIFSRGPRVYASAQFDRLRLDYPILKEIPLEGIANAILGKKEMEVYDASQLVASVPVLKSEFGVDSINLPTSPDSIGVGVTVKQL